MKALIASAFAAALLVGLGASPATTAPASAAVVVGVSNHGVVVVSRKHVCRTWRWRHGRHAGCKTWGWRHHEKWCRSWHWRNHHRGACRTWGWRWVWR